eukprot:705938-Amphidinium_carterae.1
MQPVFLVREGVRKQLDALMPGGECSAFWQLQLEMIRVVEQFRICMALLELRSMGISVCGVRLAGAE